MSKFKSSDRIRRAKHEKNYTVILNATIQDSRLSWKARGLHHYILSLPDDWDICIAHLSEQSLNDGMAIVKSALKELETLGYLSKVRLKDDRGRFLKCVWDIYETPQVDFQLMDKTSHSKTSQESPQVDFPQVDKPQVDKPQVDKPQVDKPQVGNQPLTSNDQPSTNLLSTEETSKKEENTNKEGYISPIAEISPEPIHQPEQKILIDVLAEEIKEPTPPTPSPLPPENVGLAIASTEKPKKRKRNVTSEDLIPFRDVWNSDAPAACIRFKELTVEDEKSLRRFLKAYGDRSATIFQEGLAFARTQKWWNDTSENKALSITNYLSKNKPEEYAGKYRGLIERGMLIPDAQLQNNTDRPMTASDINKAKKYLRYKEALTA